MNTPKLFQRVEVSTEDNYYLLCMCCATNTKYIKLLSYEDCFKSENNCYLILYLCCDQFFLRGCQYPQTSYFCTRNVATAKRHRLVFYLIWWLILIAIINQYHKPGYMRNVTSEDSLTMMNTPKNLLQLTISTTSFFYLCHQLDFDSGYGYLETLFTRGMPQPKTISL